MKALTSILSILALAVTVHAAEGDKKPEAGKKKAPMNADEMIKRLDKDGNGSISKEEYLASPQAKKDTAKAEERFGKMDKNKDGSLSKEELTPKPKKDAK
ncbi:MAG: EF-hand domain-containing protein [Verrucomicrobiaceae bacterium]|jgi:Ca2+-binding EF-hand superfamily protein|nr:EF-hand domain-containing protein [Verrucomicrobiaceae bacterium]